MSEFNEVDFIGSDLLDALDIDEQTSFNKKAKPFIPTNFNIPKKQPKEHEFDKNNIPKDKEYPDGTWECSKCQNYNYAGRRNCNSCKKPKFLDMNWTCSNCQNYNFRNRKNCNKCDKPKASDEVLPE